VTGVQTCALPIWKNHAVFRLGRWDEAAANGERLLTEAAEDLPVLTETCLVLAMLYRERGDSEGLERIAGWAGYTESADAQVRDFGLVGQAVVAQARGRHDEAQAIVLASLPTVDPTSRAYAYQHALEAAWALEDHAQVEGLVSRIEGLPRVMAPPSLRAHGRRYAGLLAARGGDLAAGADQLAAAAATLGELGFRYEMGCVLLERAEIVLAAGQGEEAVSSDIREARTIFAELGAKPMLERAERASGAEGEAGDSPVVSASG